MTTDRFDRARELFIAACEIAPQDRGPFLDEECGGDDELRSEVEELLLYHKESSSSSGEETPLFEASSQSGHATRIGRYRLIHKLGEGGMGEVYEAEQEQPIRRRVALKIIKWGMDTEQVVARFESERQALALMDHPNIARVYDAGATDQGRPFFAMEFVQGVAITDYCDRNRLTTQERLELFIQVCHGVQHAHQKGVIHRDLKPSNILVAIGDQGATPKIIDFGIAKATSQRLTEHSVFTELGQWIGTPEYMSPEQADLTALDIDTRTDVYSLGVVLYELLVGAQPFASGDLRASGFDEMRRIIREQDPPRPSTRVSSLGDQSKTNAERRATDSTTLARLLRGDLDWITMRALEKDRTRRYLSPTDLAADVERHLSHQPVDASPPGLAYRSLKFARRHSAAVIAGGLILSALVAGLVIATVGMVRAQRAEQVANTQVELLIDLFDTLDPGGEAGGTASTEEILVMAAERIEYELGDSPLIRARLLATIGGIHSNLGAHNEALQALEESLSIRRTLLGPDHPDVADSLRSIGSLLGVMGDYSAAREHLEHALEIDEQIYGSDHTVTADTVNTLAVALWRDNAFEEAIPLFDRALEIRERAFGPHSTVVADSLYMQAVLLRDIGYLDRARTGLERALAIRETSLGPNHTQVAWTLGNYGFLLAKMGENEPARQCFERALAIQQATFGTEHYTSIEPLIRLGDLRLRAGDLDGAQHHFQQALEIGTAVYGDDHHFLAGTLDQMGRTAQQAGNPESAREFYRQGLWLRQRQLGQDHPQVAASLALLGHLEFSIGLFERARDHFARQREILERAHGPDSYRAARARISLAWANARCGDLAEAGRLYHSAIQADVDHISRSPAGAGQRFFNHACLAALVGERADTIEWSRRAIDAGIAPQDFEGDPDLESIRRDPRFRSLMTAD